MASPTPVPIPRTTATDADSLRGISGSDWSGLIDRCGSPGNLRSSLNVSVVSAVQGIAYFHADIAEAGREC
jgi:hypothetical protein